jgi:hypothetical protein
VRTMRWPSKDGLVVPANSGCRGNLSRLMVHDTAGILYVRLRIAGLSGLK